jgi:hypothetical protein
VDQGNESIEIGTISCIVSGEQIRLLTQIINCRSIQNRQKLNSKRRGEEVLVGLYKIALKE